MLKTPSRAVSCNTGDDAPFLSCRKGNPTEINAPFWTFKAATGATEGVMADHGIGGAVGKFTWVVKAVGPAGTPDIIYTAGSEIEFELKANGDIVSPLGNFTYSEANFQKETVSTNAGQHVNATWFSPNNTTVPRKEFTIDANDTELKAVTIRDKRSQSVTVVYVIGETYP